MDKRGDLHMESANYNLPVRKLLRYFLITLLLLMVAFVSALTTMRLAIHVREVRVPDFRGRTSAEARNLAEQNGLGIQIETSYYSPNVPEGKVLSQGPAPGALVRRGWEVQVALSLGPQRVAIPQLVGESDRAAAISITERGLQLGSTDYLQLAESPAGEVIAQNPPANATDVVAPKISLLVTQTPAPVASVMPNFIGQSLGTVTSTLKGAGFTIGKVMVSLPPTPPALPSSTTSAAEILALPTQVAPAPAAPSSSSIVVSQDPPPGHKVLAGSATNLVVK